MKNRIIRYLLIFMGVSSIGVGGYFVFQMYQLVGHMEALEHQKELADTKRWLASEDDVEEESTWVSLKELFVNVGSLKGRSHSLAIRMELELFEESNREVVDRFQSGIRDMVIQAALEQKYAVLQTVEGKLYFKEILVSRINQLLNKVVVRDVHFGSFYLN